MVAGKCGFPRAQPAFLGRLSEGSGCFKDGQGDLHRHGLGDKLGRTAVWPHHSCQSGLATQVMALARALTCQSPSPACAHLRWCTYQAAHRGGWLSSLARSLPSVITGMGAQAEWSCLATRGSS